MKKFLFLLSALLLCACTSSSHSGTQADATTLSHFERGVTTYGQVVQALGQPNRTGVTPDGSKTATYNATNARNGANSVNGFAGGTGMSMAQSGVTFVFDDRDVLKYYTTSQVN